MQRAVVVFFPVLFLLSLVGTAGAQVAFPTPTPTPRPRPSPRPTPEPRAMPCPTVTVQAQANRPIRDGQPVGFVANIRGGDPKVVPLIMWSTAGGAVKDGQNTRTIMVDTTGAGSSYDREVRAEVWVGGYAPECYLQAAGSVKVIPNAEKFGEFGEVDAKTLSDHLDTLAKFLSQSPDNLYLIAYAGRNSERGFTYRWVKQIKDGLIAAGVSPRRIQAIDGGFREEPLFDFWTVPAGSAPPIPEPTVKRSEIVYPPNGPPAKPAS